MKGPGRSTPPMSNNRTRFFDLDWIEVHVGDVFIEWSSGVIESPSSILVEGFDLA